MSPGANRLDLRTVAAGELSAVASAVTSVESLADLKLMVNDPQGAVAVGAEVTYEVRIVNRGTKAAENVLILGYFSEGIEPIAVRGWRGRMNEGEVVLERIPRLGPGQEMLVKIAAQANRPGDHVFRAELECGDPETKLAVEEWTRFYGDLDVQASLPADSAPADESSLDKTTRLSIDGSAKPMEPTERQRSPESLPATLNFENCQLAPGPVPAGSAERSIVDLARGTCQCASGHQNRRRRRARRTTIPRCELILLDDQRLFGFGVANPNRQSTGQQVVDGPADDFGSPATGQRG